jgi:predicted nicotinamide N-methyase
MATEDVEDIFDTSLGAVFDIAPIAFSTPSPTALHTYTPQRGGPPIHLQLAHPPANLHALQVNYLWLAGIYLADLICCEVDLSGKRVAELGAGAGLPGIMAARKGAEVVSSDWAADEVLDVLRANFKRNATESAFEVVGHRWGTDPTGMLNALATQATRFDTLLLADTLWITDAHSALLDSILALLSPSGIVHIAAGLHTGRGPVQRFISAATARGATVTPVREVCWKIGGGWGDYNRPEGGLEEERGVVVYFTLHLQTRAHVSLCD